MKKLKMLLVSYSPLVSDARILKQISLFKDTFELTTCGYGPAPEGVAQHFQIPDDCVYWKRNRIFTILRLYTRAYWSSAASAWCRENVPRDHYDVTFADDIDSIGFGLWTRPKFGVHADLHEYSPREKEDVWRWRVFVKPYMEWQVKHFVARAKTCSTTASFFASEYRRNFGINPTVVVNATPFHDLAPSQTPDSGPIRLVHAGTCRPDRYTEIMIDAVSQLPERYTLDLYLVKNDAAYFAKLEEKCRSLPNVNLHEGAPYRELIDTLHRYDLGIHNLPPVNFNNKYALPNKFFDFVQARLGMVIGPTPEMASRLEKYQLGRVAKDFTAASLQQALEATTREEVTTWKKNADKVAGELSSENVVGLWKEAVESIVGTH